MPKLTLFNEIDIDVSQSDHTCITDTIDIVTTMTILTSTLGPTRVL